MLYFSRSKVTLILFAVLVAFLFAFPNLFTEKSLKTFPSFIPNQQVNLGLDLQGGSHLLLEVDTDEIVKEKIEVVSSDLRKLFKKEGEKINNLKTNNNSLRFNSSSTNVELINKIKDISISSTQNILQTGAVSNLILEIEGDSIQLTFSDVYITQLTLKKQLQLPNLRVY